MRSLVDPLFNRRIFIVFSATTLALCIVAALKLKRLPAIPVRTEAVGLSSAESSYQFGFRRGYDAFLKQTGKYTPTQGAAVSYTSSHDMDEDEVDRGYVDGYHKATESEHCPRSVYEY